MKNEELVSVIIPTYNAENYINSTIDSIIGQTYKQIEIIVVDDKSTDQTERQLKDYIKNNKISFYKLEENTGGPATPRNFGISKAKGKWLAFCDSDDIWHPKKTQIQLESMYLNKCEFSCTKKQNFIDELKINFSSLKEASIFKISYNRLLLKDFIPTSSVMIEKKIIGDLKFDESKKMISVEDYLFWLNVMKNSLKPCVRINQKLMFYRISSEQISRNKTKRIPQFVHMFSTHFENQKWIIKMLKALIFTFTHYNISLIEKLIDHE